MPFFRQSARIALLLSRRATPFSTGLCISATLAAVAFQNVDVRQRFVLYNEAFTPSAQAVKVDPATSIAFPTQLKTVSDTPILALVGVGVRTVSFLRVKVYSAGFYLDQKADLPRRDAWDEEAVRKLIERHATAIQIVPVRNTDMAHLRDGFVRAVQARRKAVKLDATEDEAVGKAILELKLLFPAQKVPKGVALNLVRNANGALAVEYDGRLLGKIENAWVSRELFTAYFANDNVISHQLKDDVLGGLQTFRQ